MELFQPESLPFSDVPEGAWYYDSLLYVYQNGIFSGTSATTFSPYQNMTRQQLWTVLGRMAGEKLSGSGVYSAARSWAVSYTHLVIAVSISLASTQMGENSFISLLLLFPPNPLRWVSAGALILSSVSSRKATQIRSNRPGRYLFSLLPAKPHTAAHRGEHGLVFAVPLLPADAP